MKVLGPPLASSLACQSWLRCGSKMGKAIGNEPQVCFRGCETQG